MTLGQTQFLRADTQNAKYKNVINWISLKLKGAAYQRLSKMKSEKAING